MTANDEKTFCNEILKINPNIVFLDTEPSPCNKIEKRLHKDFTLSDSLSFSIVNLDITSKSKIEKNYEIYGDMYHFSSIGRGQIQLLRGFERYKAVQNLENGRIAFNYNKEDSVDYQYKNSILKILRKLGKKVYCLYDCSNGVKIAEKADTHFVVLPDAALEYNGKKQKLLVSGNAKFVPEGITVDDLV